MKKSIIIITLLSSLCYVILSSNSNGVARASGVDATGASGAGTGANQGCSCHNNITTQISVFVELDSAGVAVSQYHGGGSYTIKISGTNNTTNTLPRFGFQLACVQANFSNAGGGTTAGSPACIGVGTWGTLPASVQLTSAAVSGLPESVIEHSAPIVATTGTGGTGTTYVESIPWTAPASGTGAVVIYGALNAVNYDGTDDGDYYNIANTLVITEAGSTSTCN